MRPFFIAISLLSILFLPAGCNPPESDSTDRESIGEAGEQTAARLLEERLEGERNRSAILETRLEERTLAENRAVRSRDVWMTLAVISVIGALVLFVIGIIMGTNTTREAEDHDSTQNHQP